MRQAISTNSITPSRRGFLRALAALPLIGGGIKILGEPTAVDVPISPAILRRYSGFLSRELFAAQAEIRFLECPDGFNDMGLSLTDASTWKAMPLWWETPPDHILEAVVTAKPSSSRVAVVLGAAGVGF